ncbi:MAG: hypothetical protein KUG64_02625 [Cycloclasticus sp.]|nr:hypothetical protein [Cycloclasticus sp.]
MSDFKVGRIRGVKQVLPVVDKQQNEKKASKMKQKSADDEKEAPEINSKNKHIDELI